MMTERLWTGLLVCGLLGLAAQASAYDFYLKVNGTKQGVFKGEATAVPWKDWMPGVNFSYSAELPTDRDTGLAVGQVQHLPVVVTKLWGAASPQLYQALNTNELLKQVELSFLNPQDSLKLFYTMTLKNATLSRVRYFMSQGQPGGLPAGYYEELSFRYQTLTVSSKQGNTEATADWGVRGR